MANANGILTEWDQGPQALTPVEPHWFTPTFTDGGGNTVISDPYTLNYNNGTAPYNVTLTNTNIDSNDVAGASVPIASYATGFNFHITSATLASGNKVIFYDQANGTYPQSSAVDILAQTVDGQGNPIGNPVTLLSDVQNIRQFRVGSSALGGNGYVLTWAVVDPATAEETVNYQGYGADGTPITGDAGVLDQFSNKVSTGESYGFGTLQDSTEANPSFVYLRGSDDNGAYSKNIGVKYETVAASGQPTSGLTLVTPPYPSGFSAPNLLNYSYERLTPTSPSGNDLAIIMRYSYVDASGATQQALDVHTLNAESGVGSDTVVALASGDTSSDLAQTVLSNGDIAVGYGDGSNDPLQVQLFDPNGNKIGAPLLLPSDEAGFSLNTNTAGQLIVEWVANTNGGQQVNYDIYNVGSSGTSPTSTNAVSISQQVTYDHGVFTLTGQASSAAGVRSVEISAEVNGVATDLGAATVNADGTFTFQDQIGANVQGFFQATETDNAGGTAVSVDPLFSLTGGLGPLYGAGKQTRYTADGEGVTADTRFRPDGIQNASVMGPGQTFTSAYGDTFNNAKQADTTFVFNPGFSLDVVNGFRVGGDGHDTLSFKGSDFGTTPQAQLGALLANSYSAGGSLYINDPTSGDAVQLKGITKQQLVHNERDIMFRA